MNNPKIKFNAATGKVDVIAGDAFDRARVHDLAPQPAIIKDSDIVPTIKKWRKDNTSDLLIIRTRQSLQ